MIKCLNVSYYQSSVLDFGFWHLKFKNILISCFHYFACRAIASAMAGVFVMVFSFSLLTVHHSLFTDHCGLL